MKTNELIIDFNYKKIKEDFDIFKFEADTSGDSKFKVYNSSFLDKPVLELKAKSLVYECGNCFYVLYDKGKTTRQKLIEEFRKEKDGDKFSIELMSPRSIEPQHLLFQLFLNALSNYSSEKYAVNNLTGKLIYYKKADVQKTGNKKFVWSIDCFFIKMTKGNILNINVSTANSIRFKKRMDFENYKSKFIDYPQYQIGQNKTLKRAEKLDDWDNNYIFKAVDNKRASSTFLDFKTNATFEGSRLGILYNILYLFKKRFSDYITFDFKEHNIDQDISFTGSGFKDNVNTKVLEKGICLINKSTSDSPELYFNELKKRLKAINPDYKVTVAKNRVKGKLNIVLVHNKTFYDKKNIDDQHYNFLEGLSTQHVTIEDFKWYLDKDCPIKDTALEVVLKELVIKQDLIDRKISLVDWSNFSYKDDWFFGISTRDKKYYFMKIQPDGAFEVKGVKRDILNYSEYDRYVSHFFKYQTMMEMNQETGKEEEVEKSYSTGIVGLVKDSEGNVNLIKETSLFAVPEFEIIGEMLENINDRKIAFDKNEIINILDELIKSTGGELFAKFKDELLTKTTCTKGDIFDATETVLMNSKAGRSGKLKRTTFFKKIHERTGERLGLYIRNAKDKAELLSNALDIKYMESPDEYGIALYSVGLDGGNVQSMLPNASRIREVIAEVETDSELFFDKLLPLMDVDFVKYGQSTVVPFPLKYLREFINQGVRLDES